MALLLAPYNNAMRIGQGFNSYTQQICINDAVVIDKDRAMNIINNNGMTMEEQAREYRQSLKKSREEEKVIDVPESDKDNSQTSTDSEPPSKEKALGGTKEKRAELTIKTEKDAGGFEKFGHAIIITRDKASFVRVFTAQIEEYEEGDVVGADISGEITRKKESSSSGVEGKDPVKKDPKVDGEGKQPVKKDPKEDTKKEPTAEEKARAEEIRRRAAESGGHPDEQGWRKVEPIGKNKSTKIYEFQERDGPSQIVVWTSKFVSKISDITDDMNISGCLSIKTGSIGGSGRGSFVDASKFQDSDLNFYISVKVVNQSINFQDALKFQPLGNVVLGKKFNDVYGDSFISGFLEGGEFNALVSMKVLHDAKKRDIAAAAKVAYTCPAGPEIAAEGNVQIAKQNLHENTETTIQVSWSGGGHIKPRDQPWDMEALVAAAARFPDLVARTPQRTYAILTKYEGLRSFHEIMKTKTYTPLQYEYATLYTNSLLDSYMDYKAMYRTVSDQIFEVESGIRKFSKIGSSNEDDVIPSDSVESEEPFASTLKGMDHARVTIRKQMSKIVAEVDAVTKNPTLVLKENRQEPFQGPVTFRTRLPKTEFVDPANNVPLSLKTVYSRQAQARLIPLYPKEKPDLIDEEKEAVDRVLKHDPALSLNFRMDSLVGSKPSSSSDEKSKEDADDIGAVFTDLDVLRPEYRVTCVDVQIHNGMLGMLRVRYSNGVSVTHGCIRDNLKTMSLPLSLHRKEVITACYIESGIPSKVQKSDNQNQWDSYEGSAKGKTVITALKLYTNRGSILEGHDENYAPVPRDGMGQRGNMKFTDLYYMEYDPLMEKGHIKGFWGWSHDGVTGSDNDVVYALGPIWGSPPTPENAAPVK